MKLGFFASAISITGAALVFACSSSTNVVGDEPDSGSSGSTGKVPSTSGSSGEDPDPTGSSGSSGSSGTTKKDAGADSGGDGGSSSGGLVNTKLAATTPEPILIGVTTDATPHVVFYTETPTGFDLYAAPVAGGAPVLLQAAIDADYAFVSGGAVAWYTGAGALKGLGTAVKIWTKANGIKTVTTPSRSSVFAASADGALVAFSTGATATSTDIAITTSANPVITTPALTGANAVNWAAPAANKCVPNLGFAGTTFIGTYCTGTLATETKARLVTAATGAAAVVRVSDASATTAIQTFWRADATGNKIFVLGPAPANEGRVLTIAGATTTLGVVETGLTAADVAKDGSYLLYTTATALKTATFAATPVIKPIVPTGLVSLLGISPDKKTVLYSTIEAEDATSGFTLSDAKSVDVTAAVPAPVTIIAAATGAAYEITGSGTHVTYFEELGAASAKVKSRPIGGGAEKVLDPASIGFYSAPEGTGVLTITAIDATDLLTMKFVDAVAGGALQNAATEVQDQNFLFSGKTFLYANGGTTAPGVYSVKLP